jgi:hypothetical protein
VVLMRDLTPVVWYVICGESPFSRATEPGEAGIDIPDGVLAWAEDNGLDADDPDVYLLVTPEDEAEVQGELTGQLACLPGSLPAEDVAAIRAVIAQDDAYRAEKTVSDGWE